jgi:hypothetical protein
MKRFSWIILMGGFIGSFASGLSFRQIAYIPLGITWSYGYIKGGDFNHDGFQDLVFSASTAPGAPIRVLYNGYRPFDRYVFEDSTDPSALFWDVGNLDGDSLLDVVTHKLAISRNHIGVFEASDYWSVPTESVWAWRYEYFGNGVQGMYITDLDGDSWKEILTGDAQIVYVFENRGDNQYVKVFSDTTSYDSITPSFAYGDFDGDGLMEFARATYSPGPHMFIYECTGDDQYQKVWVDSLPEPNNYDLITGSDLDGDGKLEIINGNNRTGPPPWAGKMRIYEATGNNQYAIIYSDSVNGLNDRGVYCVHSDCGDVDRDGRPELVWAIDRDWMVYKSPGNNMFQRVFSAYGDNGHNSTNVHIHDMNGNGYPEIIESGGNETHIWEVETCRLVYPNGGETLYGDSLAVIRWRNVDPFRADSFSLFYSSDSGLTYSPVAHGIPGSDSAYTWTVPKTFSDDCFVMLWAYQNATGWDFSDSHFRIRPGTGVEQGNGTPFSVSRLPYRVAPNPFVSFATLPGHEKEQFALYDVSGRKVGNYPGSRIGYDLSAGIYFLKPEVKDAKPIRLVKLR